MSGIEEQKRAVTAFYERLWNRWDDSAVEELLSPSIRFRGSLGQYKQGHAEFREYRDFIRRAFPDFTNTLEEMVSEGEKLFARLTYRGTQEGEVFGVAPTGTSIEYAGAALFTFSAGKIAQVWVLGDVHGLLEQLRSPAP